MNQPRQRKPDWLKVRLPAGANYLRIDAYHRKQGLHSVCRSAACPNQGECWNRGTATFMILGNSCTRDCAFCNVGHGQPLPPDPAEPEKVAQAVAELGLKHAVITSVTRDDLPDGGAAQFAALTEALHRLAPDCRVELLIPDLQGNEAALSAILASGPDILGHNLETVPRLYPAVRRGASYERSLQLLKRSHSLAPQIATKSGIMLGMGETREEVVQLFHELLATGCLHLTIGQYLAPTLNHYPVERYVPPDEFTDLKRIARSLGFRHVEAGPLVRSSYHADMQLEEADHD